MNEVSETLRSAALVIKENGWHQGDFYDAVQVVHCNISPENARVCARGAIIVACGSGLDRIASSIASHSLESAATVALQNHLGVAPISWWNDNRERTQDDVVTALLDAANAVEASDVAR